MKTILLSILLLVSSLGVAEAITLSDIPVGTIVSARGTNTVNGEAYAVSQNVYVGDIIKTEEKGFLVIQLTDGSKVTVRPGSKFAVIDYLYGGDTERAEFILLRGGLRIITGAIAKNSPDNYKIKTPVALMGVRGTEFSVMLCDGHVCELDNS